MQQDAGHRAIQVQGSIARDYDKTMAGVPDPLGDRAVFRAEHVDRVLRVLEVGQNLGCGVYLDGHDGCAGELSQKPALATVQTHVTVRAKPLLARQATIRPPLSLGSGAGVPELLNVEGGTDPVRATDVMRVLGINENHSR